MKSRIFNATAFLCGIALLVWIIIDTGPRTLLKHLQSVGSGFVLIILLYFVQSLIEVATWRMLAPGHARPGYFRMLAVSQAGAALNGILPGQTGEIVKGTLLRGHMNTRWIVPSLLMYNFLYIATSLPVLVICALAVLLSGILPVGIALALAGAALATAIFPTLLFIWIRRGMTGDTLKMIQRLPFLGRFVKDSLIKEGSRIDRETRSIWEHRTGKVVLASILLTVARFIAIAEVGLILFLMNNPVSWTMSGGIYAASKIFSFIVMFLPTSFGVMEGASRGIFELFGLAGGVGLSFELVRRIRKIFFFLVGIICIGIVSIVRKKGCLDRGMDDSGGNGDNDTEQT